MLNKVLTSVLFCSFLTATTVKLVPPKISSETILERIVCTRPMRNGKFNISLEKQADKTIVHCYGHGGAGWTTLFGSVNKAIRLFQASNPSLDTPVRVIGSGCMGLSIAVELRRLGYNVAGITTKNLYDIPSWQAAGNFGLCSIKCSVDKDDLYEILLSSFTGYQAIERGEHPYFTADAVSFMPVYCSPSIESGVEDLEERGLIPPREIVTLDFGNGVIHENFVKFMTYFMNTTTLMQQLTKEAERLAIPIEIEEVQSFEQIAEKVIFNCSGLGASELNRDGEMTPVRGHLFLLNESAGTAHMDYMICADLHQEDVYVIPKNISVSSAHPQGLPCAGAIGGTFIPNADPAQDEIEFQRLLDRNSQFFQGHLFR